MSGQVHGVGSIVDFWPIGSSGAGVASVVVSRDGWIIRTELRRVFVAKEGIQIFEPDAKVELRDE